MFLFPPSGGNAEGNGGLHATGWKISNPKSQIPSFENEIKFLN